MTRSIWVAAAVIGSMAMTAAQQLTIREEVRLSQPGPSMLVKTKIAQLGPPIPLGDLARGADLIVEGTVAPLRSYLSDDERIVYTDYAVSPIRILAAKAVASTRVPGPQPIIVRQVGGDVVIDGVTVRFVHGNLGLFKPGAHLILLLNCEQQTGRYEVAGAEVYGAFGVEGSTVRPLMSPESQYERYIGVPLKDFVAEIDRSRQRPSR